MIVRTYILRINTVIKLKRETTKIEISEVRGRSLSSDWRRSEDNGRMNVRETASKEGFRTDTKGRTFLNKMRNLLAPGRQKVLDQLSDHHLLNKCPIRGS
jgi:hypothetical protein